VKRFALFFGILLVITMIPGSAEARPKDGDGPIRAIITFVKNPSAPDNSTITWRLDRKQGGKWVTEESLNWRAGSGMLGKRGKNECIKNVGWLPNGNYGVRLRTPYRGRLIKGNVLQVDNKYCNGGRGVLRQSLFIHTEQGDGGKQCKNRPGDDVCRWEYPRFNDYRSYGCIKMAPGDLRGLVAAYRAHLRPEVRYPLNKVVLKVITGKRPVAHKKAG
jgi:hypothetical protein